MSNLNFAIESRRHVLAMLDEIVTKTLEKSKGQNEMSAEDMKMAIISLHGTVQHQAYLIETLYAELSRANEKKPLLRRLFKK